MNVGRCNNLEESALNEKYASTLPANSVTPSERYDSDVNSQMPEQFRRRQVLGPPHHGDLLAREGPGNLKTHIRVNLHLLRRRLRKATQRPAHLGQWQRLLLVWHGYAPVRIGSIMLSGVVENAPNAGIPIGPSCGPPRSAGSIGMCEGPGMPSWGCPFRCGAPPNGEGPAPGKSEGPACARDSARSVSSSAGGSQRCCRYAGGGGSSTAASRRGQRLAWAALQEESPACGDTLCVM